MLNEKIASIAKLNSNEEIYLALLNLTKELVDEKGTNEGKKKLYYISAEFLIGKLLSNNLINLGIYDQVEEELKKNGKTMAAIEEVELEPSLGNGGLGRLAACFLDSLSTMNLPAYGCGIRYHYGIFEQAIENGYQVESPDNWLENGDPWAIKRNEYSVEVKFGGTVKAVADGKGGYNYVQENYQSVMAIP